MAECGPCRGSSAPQAQLRGVGGPSGRQHSPSPTPPAQPFRLSWFPAAPEGPAGQCVAGVGWALYPQPCQAILGLWLRETGGRPPSQAGLLAPAPRLAPNPPCLAAGTLSFRGHAQVAGGRSPCVQQTRAPGPPRPLRPRPSDALLSVSCAGQERPEEGQEGQRAVHRGPHEPPGQRVSVASAPAGRVGRGRGCHLRGWQTWARPWAAAGAGPRAPVTGGAGARRVPGPLPAHRRPRAPSAPRRCCLLVASGGVGPGSARAALRELVGRGGAVSWGARRWRPLTASPCPAASRCPSRD